MLVDKLRSLGAHPVSMNEIDRARLVSLLKARVGRLPKDYLDTIEYFSGDIEFNKLIFYKPINPSPWTSKNGEDMVDQLYGFVSKYKSTSIFDVLDAYKNRLPLNWIPIGSAPGGNLICISNFTDNFGAVGFWDHESEGIPDQGKVDQKIFLIANSFGEFIEKLTVEKLDESVKFNLDDVKVSGPLFDKIRLGKLKNGQS